MKLIDNFTQNIDNSNYAVTMCNPYIICIATSILFYQLTLLCSSNLSCISSPSLRSTAFPSYLFLSSILKERFLLLSHICHIFRKKLFLLNISQSALFIVLLQIPPRSSPWPWCLENTWQYMLSCWLMQLHRFCTLHTGLLSFVLDFRL